MVDITQLQHLAAFHKYGTLSQAAEALHISQPALSRSMQKLEEELQVSLFDRQKNKIRLNHNGQLAVDHARRILESVQDMAEQVQAADRRSRTISLGSCVPAPTWTAVPALSNLYPGMTISSEIQEMPRLLEGLRSGLYQIIVLPCDPGDNELYCQVSDRETLFLTLPPGHPFAKKAETGMYLEELDGETVLLFSTIGFWHSIHVKLMPHSRFLIQHDRATFNELVNTTMLPSFMTNKSIRYFGKKNNRVLVPLLNPETSIDFHYICKKSKYPKLKAFFEQLPGKE
ncbi:MAG: LysR family transcriptional regulator [Acidaminococcaceae bacterium]|nr:LysR family transcriptional regulator [Acidaminococcaceae bacterium]MBQ9635048.1 LysR family transcriptional regulator [Acidaminococcaceae bacterium]MBR1590410.1 LysR family transcriptional regulator [Acidaminococcaceae bacterium]